jgi:hypothetical protein
MARVAVIEKFCRVMAGLGVPAANVFIYDGNNQFGGSISSYKTYFSTTDTSKIPGVVCNLNDELGGTASAALPDGSSAECTANIAKGKVDILINIANNKGHALFGGSTLCMKNHFGTFVPPSMSDHNNLSKMSSYTFNINKSDAILGGTPVRQQLCFVDSLIANKASNSGTPEAIPAYLVMGTFAPAVDYLTVKKIREGVMSATHDSSLVNSFMTSFGYTTSDPVWVSVPPATTTTGPDAGAGGSPGKDAGVAGSDGSVPKGTGGSGAGGKNAGGANGTGGSNVVTGGGGAGQGKGGSPVGGTGGGAGSPSGGRTVSAGGSGGGGKASGGSVATQGSGGSAGSGGGGGRGGGGGSLANEGKGGADTNGNGAGASGCRVAGGSPSGWGLLAALGTVAVGQIRRLVLRREKVEQDHETKVEDAPPSPPRG